jgi:hypothetical protein
MDTVIIFATITITTMHFDQPEQHQSQHQESHQAHQQPQYDDNLTHLIDRMDTLERKLDLILLKLDGSVINNCDKMGTHIDFVNGVYATVKIPLNYIANKIHKIINPVGSYKELPLITDPMI